jgi:proline dehydrogenase
MINSLIAKALRFFPKSLIWVFSRKYIAGEHIEDALRVCHELNAGGFLVTVDLLGENIHRLEEARKYTKQYIELIQRFHQENINGNFSVKPSMFGLHIDFETCLENLMSLLEIADRKNTFIRIDMEDSTYTSDEITLFRKLKGAFPNKVGLVLQAYLKRTSDDIWHLMDLHQGNSPLNIRLCKGIYIEDQAIAFKDFQEIRDHYIDDLDFLLKNEVYVGIATHDKYLIDKAISLIEKYDVPKDKYEFQMLYGVTPGLAQMILNKGHRIRIYVPYGVDWLNYSIRRLNENPHIVNHIIKAMFVTQ